MSEIKKESDLSVFKKHEQNDAMDPKNLRNIIASITAHNMLEYRPILVDKDMRVIDGNHRLEAAKQLGLDIYYQMDISATHENIVLLNSNSRTWKINNYVDYYASLGSTDYIRLNEFLNKKQIQVGTFLRIIKGKGGKANKTICGGTFKFPSPEKIQDLEIKMEKIDRIQQEMSRYLIKNHKCARSKKMQGAVLSLMENPDLDVEVLLKKIAYKADAIHPCADSYGYYVMMRDIYNWKNPNPIE